MTSRTSSLLTAAAACSALLAFAPVPTQASDSIPASATEVRPLLLGSTAPDVSLQSTDGQTVDFGALVRSKPTVVIFYRGGW